MFGQCKVCGKPAVTAGQYCVLHWDEVWNQFHAEVEARIFQASTGDEVRITTPTEVEYDSCWTTSAIGDDSPALANYVWSEERGNRWYWHKLEKTTSAA